MSPEPAWPTAPVRMTLWKDRDPEAIRVPGMYAGSVDGFDDPLQVVDGLVTRGVQFARLHDVVDLDEADGAAAVTALVVIRELTSHGIAVDWTLRLPSGHPAGPAGWRMLSHLYPPSAVLSDHADEDISTQWRNSFHAAKCGYRHGPGFIEIRDRRTGSFKRLVIRYSQRDQGIQPLLRGVPAAALTEAVKVRYLREDLLHQAGQFLWWTPYRIRRWPLSTTIP